ncbi:MAG TPA: tripartite tricarboxylate transporter TctB family protein [Dongiaceae bacterium]|jgi:putative tricarboxylic transport membrane protein
MPSRDRLLEILLGLGLIGLGLFFAIETTEIKVSPAYAKVGPTVFPWIVAGGLILLGAVFAIQAWRRGPRQTAEHPEPVPGQGYPATPPAPPSDWRALLIISAALLLQALLLKSVGFVIMAAVLFYAVAYSFGSRRYLRDGVIAVALAVIVYLGFTLGLHLQLPAGMLGGMM